MNLKSNLEECQRFFTVKPLAYESENQILTNFKDFLQSNLLLESRIFANIETFHHEFYEFENQILTNFTDFLVTNSQTSCSKSEFCKYIQTFHDELIITATKL